MRANSCWRPKQVCDYSGLQSLFLPQTYEIKSRHKMVPCKTLQTISDSTDPTFVAVMEIYQKKFSRILPWIPDEKCKAW